MWRKNESKGLFWFGFLTQMIKDEKNERLDDLWLLFIQV